MIGHRCKRGNAFSRVILITRLAFTLYFCVLYTLSNRGTHSDVFQASAMVAIAAGPHLFPSRTQQLSPLAPMVLHGQLCGRVGHRHRWRLFFFVPVFARILQFASQDHTFLNASSGVSPDYQQRCPGGAQLSLCRLWTYSFSGIEAEERLDFPSFNTTIPAHTILSLHSLKSS